MIKSCARSLVFQDV